MQGRPYARQGPEFTLEAARQAGLGEEPNAQRGMTTLSEIRAWLRAAAGIGISAVSRWDRLEEWSYYYYGEGQLPNMEDARRELLRRNFDQQGVVRACNRSREHRQVFALAKRRHPCGVTMVRPGARASTVWRAGTRRTSWTVVSFLTPQLLGASTPMDRRVCLITGGAGFLGINLCRHLLTLGYSVRSLDIAPFEYPEKNVVNAIQGDIRDPAAVERAMSDAHAVIHCAAALPLSSRAEIISTGVDGTRVLLQRALQGRVARFIYISSTAVYGIPDHHPLREEDKLCGVGPYGESKIEAEGLCLQFRSKGLCLPILRPKSFVGPERLGVFELLYEWAYDGKNFPVLGSGSNRYQLLDVADLCEVIARCMTYDSNIVDDTFNVGAMEFGTMRENFQAVLDRAGHEKRVIAFPAGPVIAVLKLLEFLHLSPLYQWIYETAAQESFVSIDRLQAKLGFVPRYSNRDALIRNYDWYAAHRDEFRKLSGVTHRVPWKKGALQVAKWFF